MPTLWVKVKMSIVIKASFQKCPLEERKIFSNSNCILPISIGYKAFEGKRLEALFSLVNRSFQSCLMYVGDSLQRHTLKIFSNMDDKEAHKQANLLGETWLNSNQSLLEQFKIPLTLKRWDEWLKHPLFHEYTKNINIFYKDKPIFAAALLQNAHEFIENSKKKYPEKNINDKQALELCLAYLKEECAAMCLWASEHYRFEVYPGGRNLAMSAAYTYLIQPSYPDMLKPVGIRYRKS